MLCLHSVLKYQVPLPIATNRSQLLIIAACSPSRLNRATQELFYYVLLPMATTADDRAYGLQICPCSANARHSELVLQTPACYSKVCLGWFPG